jgi:hypothetical protein
VLMLRLAGLSIQETARLLGLSAKSVEGAYTRARARVRLIGGAVLAWLAERARRVSSPRTEAFFAAVAVLFFAGPLWPGAADLAQAPHRGVGSAAAALRVRPGAATGDASTARTVGQARAGAAAATSSWHGGGGGGDGRRPVAQFSTGPINVPVPNPTNPKPLLTFWGGPVTVTVGQPSPVTDIEKCLQEGGPRVSVSNGGCD